jgi:diacylglycerol kinase family enzyme
MIAAALLHPDVSSKVVDRFRSSGIEIKIQDNLEHCESCSAALIFGGDGTVHRHLPQLHQQKIPTLVVPTGSGNDFAKAFGNPQRSNCIAGMAAILRPREKK